MKEEDINNLMFGDFMDIEADKDDRLYQEIKDIDQFQKIVVHSIKEYNNTNKNRMELTIFRYLLEHLAHICRILRISGGHGLLVGVGGSGRQSLSRLAASMGGFQVFQPEISKNYGNSRSEVPSHYANVYVTMHSYTSMKFERNLLVMTICVIFNEVCRVKGKYLLSRSQ